jgi:hypothetical protein
MITTTTELQSEQMSIFDLEGVVEDKRVKPPAPLVNIDLGQVMATLQRAAQDMDEAASLLRYVVMQTPPGDSTALRGELSRRISLLSRIEQVARWAIGDEIVAARDELGKMEAYRVAGASMGASERWALEVAKVSEAFPPDMRYAGVEWNLYRACANTKHPHNWLNSALRNGWDADIVREKARHAREYAAPNE